MDRIAEQAEGAPIRVAFIGMRGLPADLPKAGGGERETEEKATRLAAMGYDVTAYCRWHYNRRPHSPYRGVRLISLPSVPTKSLDTLTHSLLATLHAGATRASVISYHGMGNGLFVPLARLLRKKSVVYMDGADWLRPKWGGFARLTLRSAARAACRWADAVYVDNATAQETIGKVFGRVPELITLAAQIREDPGAEALGKWGLEPEQYVLFVGLLKPDKGVHLLLEAYERLETDLPLVIVGDSPDGGPYVTRLKATEDGRVRFLGYVYGQDAQQLFANALLYVQPSLVEGNSPALMTAMSYGRCVISSDIPENAETVGEAGRTFASEDAASLAAELSRLLQAPDEVELLGRMARARIKAVYNWDVVLRQLDRLYRRL
ncbi:MAG: glycosyltransferase family 4 protein [Coriobacteriia bacterium]|nr:glycosyltransferase family 4 protein [Coriobacteriia bacterium]